MVFCRRFSFTSYPTDRVINNILRLSKDARDVLIIEESDVETYKKYLGKNNIIINEYEEITCISDLISELNCNTPDGERNRVNFKQKLDTIINNKPLYNKNDLLNMYEVITQECSYVFGKLSNNNLRNNNKTKICDKWAWKFFHVKREIATTIN